MKRKVVLKLFLGFFFGFIIPILLRRNVERKKKVCVESEYHEPKRQLLFIGIMTAQKFLDSRAVTMHQTWGQEMKGSLLFFSGSDSRTNHDLPLVNLPTVDDSYPPQKKSFLMLKYMNDLLGDKYDWFLRGDDDVFIDVERLKSLLYTLDSRKMLYIGQAGVGNRQEFGQLNLRPDQNFCMGGPGVLFSRTALKELVNHVPYCLEHLKSSHEDVEVGRCVNEFLNISCSWSYEMQHLFYHNFSGEIDPRNVAFAEVMREAITLHPVKQVESIFEIHAEKLRLKHLELRSSLPSRHKSKGNSLQTWDYIDSRFHYSSANFNPKRGLDVYWRKRLSLNQMEIVMNVNKRSKSRGKSVALKGLNYGYFRVNELRGVDYILDMYLVYQKYGGKKKSSTVQKHVQGSESFSRVEIKKVEWRDPETVVNIVVPLSGRLNTFRKFLGNFRSLYSIDSHITLAVIMFPDVEETQQAKSSLVQMMRDKYPVRLAQLAGTFSRAAALQRGAALYNSSSLLFFLDVDMRISPDVIQRVRLNTILGKQVYFPIIFSQYHPDFVLNRERTLWNISNDAGHWRLFGYGIVSLFNKDLIAAGGLNLAIRGWGKEDVDLFERLLKVVQVFRTPDPGLIHMYHESNQCEQSLSPEQKRMCEGTKLSTFGSKASLAKFLHRSSFRTIF